MNDSKLVSERRCSENESPNFTTTTFTHHEETDRKQSIFSYNEADATTSAHKPIPETNATTIIPHHPTMKTNILSSSSQRHRTAALDETMSTLSITSKPPAQSANNESGLSSTTAATDKRRNKPAHNEGKKSITFGTVSTYFFPTILGDSPAVSDGCPIALGSKCVSMQTLDLRTHEMMVMAEQQQLYNERHCQPKQRKGPHRQQSDADGTVPYCPTRLRRGKELYIPVLERSKLLIDNGYSIHEIVKTVMAVEDAKKLRAESIKVYKWQSKIKGMIDFSGGGRKHSLLRKVLTVNNNNNSSTSITKKNQDGKLTSSSSASSGKPHSVQARSA